MSDAIYRQQAIDTIKELREVALKNWHEPTLSPNVVIDALSDLPSAPSWTGEWIPVTERLPEVHESGNSFSGIFMQSNPVLVYGTCEYEDNAQFHVVTYCDDLDGNTYWSTEPDAITVSGVIAWMPLPQPYMEETNA